jgi:WD40 repeat protein
MRIFDLPAQRSTDAMQFSPDGRLLAIQGFGRVDVLDTATGTTRRVCAVGDVQVGTPGVGFTADGRGVVYFKNRDSSVHAFSLETGRDQVLRPGRKVSWRSGRDASISAVQLDGRLVFVAVSPEERAVEVVVLGTSSGRRKFSFARHRSYVRELAVSPDGGWVAGCTAIDLRVWEIGGGKRPNRASWHVQDRKSATFSNLALARDGAFLAAGVYRGNGRARVWDLKAGAELDFDGSYGGRAGLAFAPDRPLLAFARNVEDVGQVVFWDAAARAELKRYDWGLGKIGAVTFSPDGFRCAAAGWTKAVVWDVDV